MASSTPASIADGTYRIHAKVLRAEPAAELATLLQAVFGMDHYKGVRYLRKLSDSDLSDLQSLLADRLRMVETARSLNRSMVHDDAGPVVVAPYMDLAKHLNPELLSALKPAAALTAAGAGGSRVTAAASGLPPRILAGIMRHVTEEAPGVYSFELFSPELLASTVELSARHAAAAGEGALTAGSDRSAVALRAVAGLRELEAALLCHIVAPLSAVLFPEFSRLDWSYAYVIGYSATPEEGSAGRTASAAAAATERREVSNGRPGSAPVGEAEFASPAMAVPPASPAASAETAAGRIAASQSRGLRGAVPPAPASRASEGVSTPGTGGSEAGTGGGPGAIPALLTRRGLVPHTDDSEVTLNVCLGTDFKGGQLVLRGLRNSAGEGSAEVVLDVKPGRAVLHLGQHLHEVTPVTAGERYALIQWARDSSYRARTCPCCLINRRNVGARRGGGGDDTCICDAAFN
jgi:hypothetical protein